MKGASMIIMVLLLVFAIPLMASPVQGNTGTEFSAISIINSKEEVTVYDVSAQYCEIECLEHKSIKQTWLPSISNKNAINYKRQDSNQSGIYLSNAGYNNSKRGGNLRFASEH